jgi:ion channel
MTIRRAFAHAFLGGLHIIWPVLSIILAFIAVIGVVVGLVEGWGVWRGLYFAFVTALTIGYGDLVPTRPLTQLLSVLAGFAGITMTALLAGVAVRAFQVSNRRADKE